MNGTGHRSASAAHGLPFTFVSPHLGDFAIFGPSKRDGRATPSFDGTPNLGRNGRRRSFRERTTMRIFGWIALCGALMLASGCGSDNRSNVVSDVSNQLSDANTKLKFIKDKLKEAIDKGDAKAPADKEMKEANEAVKELATVPAALQQIMVKASRRAPLTEDEKKEARRRGAGGLNETLKELNTTVHDLEKQVGELKSKYGEKTRDFSDKLETAMNDFRNLGAQNK
jgi:regulator of replication initiation timing